MAVLEILYPDLRGHTTPWSLLLFSFLFISLWIKAKHSLLLDVGTVALSRPSTLLLLLLPHPDSGRAAKRRKHGNSPHPACGSKCSQHACTALHRCRRAGMTWWTRPEPHPAAASIIHRARPGKVRYRESSRPEGRQKTRLCPCK